MLKVRIVGLPAHLLSDNLIGRVFIVVRREYTSTGVIYHLSDEFEKQVFSLHEKYVEVI